MVERSLRRIYICSRTYSASALRLTKSEETAMPYSAEHKQRTRAHIVDCARVLFNRKGFAEVSIDEIMASAGLTRGGCYNHFKTEEDLDDIEGHCPMVALPSDVARAGAGVKRAYHGLLERMAGMLAQGAEASAGAEAARQRGLALAALCVGGMVLARTIEDDAFREEIRAAARATAHELID